jgi:hypothetical protein
MAISCFRFFRALRTICAPITAIVGFSFLLTWIFILYQPSPGPGVVQRLGWQSWDVITMPDASQTATPAGSSSGHNNVVPEGVDWWNVTLPEDKVDSSNFPLDVWAPLLPHNTGCALIHFLYVTVDKC